MATKLYDGTLELVKESTYLGGFLHTQQVTTDGIKVNFMSLMQKNYSVIDKEILSLTREEAIAAARAILQHFNETPVPAGKEEW